MIALYRFILLSSFSCLVVSQNCTNISSTLNGTWTSTNFGTITISSTARTLSMSKNLISASSTTGSYFDCYLASGTQYVFRMNKTLSLSGLKLYIYGCFDFRQASDNAFYYYLMSEQEVLLSGYRFVLIDSTKTVLFGNVCDSAVVLDTAEFHTMIRTGYEDEAISALRCPDPILGVFRYTYTDSTGTYCTNTNSSSIGACNTTLNYAEVVVNNTGCTSKYPFFSQYGVVGCIATVYNSTTETYYTSYYNEDSPFTSQQNVYHRFTCVVMQKATNGTVYLSLMPTDCVAGQTATVRSTSGTLQGATMVLDPICIPPTVEKQQSFTWLIVFLAPVGALIIVAIVVVILHFKCKAMEKKKAREKKILITEEHPLGEMSIALDAPASMDRIPNGYIDVNNELFLSPRKKKGDLVNPMGESSMNLSFRKPSWATLSSRRSNPNLMQMDPFSEMDSGIVMPISPEGSKTVKSFKSSRQKSFSFNTPRTDKGMMNGDAGKPLAITDGRTPYPLAESPDYVNIRSPVREKSFTRDNLARSQSVYAPMSIRAASVRAPSVRAPSVKSNHNHKAPSVRSTKTDRSVPKMIRSVTSTKIGSVTRRGMNSTRKKKMTRSKTMVLPSESHDPNEGGMADFMNAEMQDWGTHSEASKSRRSTRTSKSRSNTSRTSPRKSILKKHSKYISSEEYLTEEEKYYKLISKPYPETSVPPGSTAPPGSPTLPYSAHPGNPAPASRTLQDEYNDMIQSKKSKPKKVKSHRKPWH